MAATDALLQGDIDARNNALDTTRSFIVQAPAGSGKTELLIQRYLKLLAEVDEPEEVLAITFTIKAAAEMRLRVIDALQKSARGERPTEPHLVETEKLARRALQRARDRNWQIVENPRRLRIQTLDGLNAAIARARPLAVNGGSIAGRIVDGARLKSSYREAAVATLDWLAEEATPGDAVCTVLGHLDNNTNAYIAHLAEMLLTRDQWLSITGSGRVDDADGARLRERLERNMAKVVDAHLEQTRFALAPYDQIATQFDYAARCLIADDNQTSAILALAGCNEIPAADASEKPRWLGLAEMLLTRDEREPQFRRRINKNQGFPTTDRDRKNLVEAMLEAMQDDQECLELLSGVRALPPTRYSDEQWHVMLALLRLLPLAVSELKRLFAERGQADYIEVAMNAATTLGTADTPGDLALLLDYRIRHILVDEMQDTSNAQYRMLETLVGGWSPDDGRTLFCVGDPMQSIYRFRNAEVGQFLLARQQGIGQLTLEPLLLRRNFRSGDRLVEWFNAVFPSVLAANNDAARGAVRYESALPTSLQADAGECHVHPVFGGDPRIEAAAGARVVADLLANGEEASIAILVRSRTQLPALLREMRRKSIRYSAVEIDRLTDLPEIIDVLALTRAAVHAGDRIAWLGVLRAPWIGLDWSDLHALVRNDRNGTVLELMHDPERIAALSPQGRQSLQRAIPHLDELCRANFFLPLRDRVERAWLALGGPAALADEESVDNVYRYLGLLAQHEIAGTLRDVAELETILDEERVASRGSSRVQVMTIHRAKGLQFDHVILYGLGRTSGSGASRVLAWVDVPREDKDDLKIVGPIGRRADTEKDPVHRFISARNAVKERHEMQRLLYVACTRAIRTLHLVGNVAIAGDRESSKPARRDSLLGLLWPVLQKDYGDAFDARTVGTTTDGADTFVMPVLRRLRQPWQLPVVELPASLDILPDDTAIARDKVEFYWVGSEARIAGTLVHRWLQRAVEQQSGVAHRDDGRIRRWLAELGVRPDRGTEIEKRVKAAIDAVLNDRRGRWLLAADGHAELALSGIYRGALTNVVLDRVLTGSDGQHWVVDYKTSSHEGGNLAGFLAAEVERYRGQLSRYAAMYRAWSGVKPRCALYFPLLQEFVEVSDSVDQ